MMKIFQFYIFVYRFNLFIYIKNYTKEINGLFQIRLAKNPQELAKTAGFRFPMFFKVEQNKATYKWSNDQFGVRATDDVEDALH